jgi:hypothetical protein
MGSHEAKRIVHTLLSTGVTHTLPPTNRSIIVHSIFVANASASARGVTIYDMDDNVLMNIYAPIRGNIEIKTRWFSEGGLKYKAIIQNVGLSVTFLYSESG